MEPDDSEGPKQHGRAMTTMNRSRFTPSTPRKRKVPIVDSLSSPWQCTETCSIVEAIQRHRNREKTNDQQTATPIDVVGIVLSVSVNLALQAAELLLTDPSLPSASYCARIKLKGSPVVSPIVNQNIGRSDIVRVNRLVIKSECYRELCHSPAQATPESRSQSQQLHIVCEFCHSWWQPEAGVLWKRLCCIQNGRTVYNEDLPENMATHPTKIRSLITWFHQQDHPASPSLTRSRSITKRCLSEISSPGVVSHVVAQVLSCDFTVRRNKKRRRFSLNSTGNRSIVAMLCEESTSTDVMGLHDCKLAWEAILKNASRQKELVRFTNLQSVLRDGNVALVPTAESLVIPLGKVSKIHHGVSEATQNSLNHSLEEETQQSLSAVKGCHQQSRTLTSPLLKIYLEELDVSLGKCTSTRCASNDFYRHLIDTGHHHGGSPRYRHATLTLKDEESGEVAVHADPAIVQTLCGSLDTKLVVQQGELQNLVCELVSALLDEETPLEWMLTRPSHDEIYKVTAVKLERI